MAVEFFMCPMVFPARPWDLMEGPFPKHVVKGPQVATASSFIYSRHDDALVVIDANASYLSTMAADPEVDRICAEADLDNVLTVGQRNAVQSGLEARNIPAQWVSAGMTWRQVIRIIINIFWLGKKLSVRTFWKQMLTDMNNWLVNGGLSNVVGFETEPPATTKQELNRQGAILKTLQFQQLPTAVQNYLLAVRDEQGWTNLQLGLIATSTVKEIMVAMSDQPKGIKRRFVRHGLTLNSTWADLPQGFKDELRTAVEDFGFDPIALGFTGATTLRTMFKTFADEWASLEIFYHNGKTI